MAGIDRGGGREGRGWKEKRRGGGAERRGEKGGGG